MTTILLGLGSALLIGAADLFGSLAGRRGRVLAVTLWVFVFGVGVILLASWVVGGTPRPRDFTLGGAAGVAGGFGLLALYAGYSRTTIGIVGPVAAVLGAALPVAVGLSRDVPGALAITGIVIGLVAIGVISMSPDTQGGSTMPAVGYGLGAGFAFGVMAIVIGFTDPDAGIWPTLPMRIVSALTLFLLATALRRPRLPERASWKFIPAAAACSAIGIGLFALAAQRDLTVAGLLLQMGYAVTAVLAIAFLGERSTPLQRLGFAGALLSITLISIG